MSTLRSRLRCAELARASPLRECSAASDPQITEVAVAHTMAKASTQPSSAISRAREIALDGWVLAFAMVCATATSVICGSLAALHSRNGLARANSAQRSRLRSVLIAAQVGFSYVLLIGAGLMVRS